MRRRTPKAPRPQGAAAGDQDDVDEEDEEEASQPPPKKRKGGKGAVAPKEPAKAPKAAKEAPKASPQRASKRAPASRARDTYPRMYPNVSDMYRECILCVMYLRVKIHSILNVFRIYPECIVKKDTYALGKIHFL